MKHRDRSSSSLHGASERHRPLLLAAIAGTALALSQAPMALALQPDDPPTQPAPASEPTDEPAGEPGMDEGEDEPAMDHPAEDAPPRPAAPVARDSYGRRVQPDEPTVLAFKSVGLDQILPFIVETTGKVVLPQRELMVGRTITIVNDQPIPRARALDLVIFALQQNGIAVVETEDLIILRDITEIDRQDVPVIGPRDSVLGRTDLGSIYEKVFALHHSTAENIHEIVKASVPSFAKTSFDAESNQVVVMGNIGLLQRLERLITSLDAPSAAALSTETFNLRYADADKVATNIKDLFSASTTTGNNRNAQNVRNFFQFPGQGGQGGRGGGGGRQGGGGSSGATSGVGESSLTSANLRVTANTQQNSVTVLAEKPILDQIREHILQDWDRPVPDEQVLPRIYDLKNSDPIKIRDTLNTIFNGTSTTVSSGNERRGNNAEQQTQAAGRFAGQFVVEAQPESYRLIVMAKSADNLKWMDDLIEQLDRPQTAGLPRIIELKHASAEELADQLNALLSQEGTQAQIQRQESGLTAGSASVSPFASDATTTTTTNQNQTGANSTSVINFWWSRARVPTTTSGASNLVAKIRIVPVWRQNALMILSPPEYQASLTDLVSELDKPGRQVLLAAVIAEVSLENATAVGLRWSNTSIIPANQDNTISIGSSSAGNTAGGVVTGTKNDLLPSLFDTSVLNVGVDLNVLLQALNQKTAVNILSEPRIFTSDNQEATFFNGQDVPFVTDSQTTDNGTLNQSFDYKAVGINLRVRPRITVRRDVDLNISLQLSSITPNQTSNGSFIIDRRQTDTHLIVKDGQTVVLSGILRSEDSDVVRKIPLLGDIPFLGELFKSTDRSKRNSEIVAFITPIVIENDEEADAANQKDRKRLDELREMMGANDQIKKAIEADNTRKGSRSSGTRMDSGD